jgi:hypothetical protein
MRPYKNDNIIDGLVVSEVGGWFDLYNNYNMMISG